MIVTAACVMVCGEGGPLASVTRLAPSTRADTTTNMTSALTMPMGTAAQMTTDPIDTNSVGTGAPTARDRPATSAAPAAATSAASTSAAHQGANHSTPPTRATSTTALITRVTRD